MNTDSPSPSAEEGTVSAPFEKLPKLNLPPKPVLANQVTTTLEPTPLESPVPVIKPKEELPPTVPSLKKAPPAASNQVLASIKKPEVTETPTYPFTNKKRATLSLPLATIAFLAALLGLIVQLLAFLNL